MTDMKKIDKAFIQVAFCLDKDIDEIRSVLNDLRVFPDAIKSGVDGLVQVLFNEGKIEESWKIVMYFHQLFDKTIKQFIPLLEKIYILTKNNGEKSHE